MKQFLFVCFFSLLLTSAAYSQNEVTVHVVNESDKPLSGAVVYVLGLDSLFINSAITNEEGIANIPRIDFRKEMLKIMAFSYQDFDVQSLPPNDVLTVKLAPLNVELAEVVVEATSTVTQKSDRLVFNIANPNITKGNDTYGLLQFTPLIRTIDDKITIIGKSSVQLYINGRKSNLGEKAIEAYLKTLPAEKIASIEIITNPSAALRVDGDQGVINLVLKKNEADGLNGRLSAGDAQRRKYNSQDGGLYFDYQKNKLNMSANIQVDNTNSEDKSLSDYYYISSGSRQSLVNRGKWNYKEIYGVLSADYNLSEKQVIGMAFNGSYNENSSERADRTGFGKIGETAFDSIIYSTNNSRSPIRNYSVNLNYRVKTNEKGNLSFDLDYLRNEKEQTMEDHFGRVEQGIDMQPYDRFRQNSEEILSGLSGKMAYQYAFNDGNNLSVGVEAYSNSSDADFFYGNWLNGAYASDPLKTNKFTYKESYLGAYASYTRVWSPKFNSRIEARVEYLDSKGVQEVTTEEIKRRYFDILPSLSLQYQFNPDNRLSYNFTSYASRPGYYSLNPFRFFLTPTTYKEYNPNLKPAYLYMNTLGYVLKGHYIFNLDYTHIEDCSNNFLVPADGGYTKYINANYGTNQSLDLSFSWNQSFWQNRLSINSSLSGTYMKTRGAVESILVNTSGFYSIFSINTNVLLSRKYDWNLKNNFLYMSPMELAQESIKSSYRFGLGLVKNFSNGIALNAGVDNLFFNSAKRSKVNENYEYHITPEYDFRRVYISVSIPFGNMKTKGANSRSSASPVKRRLKE
jgi:hypothetical protein